MVESFVERLSFIGSVIQWTPQRGHVWDPISIGMGKLLGVCIPGFRGEIGLLTVCYTYLQISSISSVTSVSSSEVIERLAASRALSSILWASSRMITLFARSICICSDRRSRSLASTTQRGRSNLVSDYWIDEVVVGTKHNVRLLHDTPSCIIWARLNYARDTETSCIIWTHDALEGATHLPSSELGWR